MEPIARARCYVRTPRSGLRETVAAYRDRFVIEEAFAVVETVLATEITSVSDGRGWLSLGLPAVRIEHTAEAFGSPVLMYLRTGHPLRTALERLGQAPPEPPPWRWNVRMAGRLVLGLVVAGAGSYFLAGVSMVFLVLWLAATAYVTGHAIARSRT